MGNIIGIDPGIEGAFVLLAKDGSVIEKHHMPIIEKPTSRKSIKGKQIMSKQLDLETLAKLMYELSSKTQMAFLERVSSRPGEGTSSSFKFGGMFWALQAMLVAFRIKYTLVHPRIWCKEIHMGLDMDMPAKQRSQIAFKALFPDQDFRRTTNCFKNHDGFVDAALIAEWGRRHLSQGSLFL